MMYEGNYTTELICMCLLFRSYIASFLTRMVSHSNQRSLLIPLLLSILDHTTVEPLDSGHKHFVPHNEVSLTQGLPVYFEWV